MRQERAGFVGETVRRPHVKGLFVSFVQNGKTDNSSLIDFGFVSDDGGYVEYTLQMFGGGPGLSKLRIAKMNQLFSWCQLDARTRIVMSDTIGEDHPVSMYFDCLRAQMGLHIRRKSFDQVVRRVADRLRSCMTYRKRGLPKGKQKRVDARSAADITAQRFSCRVFENLAKRGVCSWITPEVAEWARSQYPAVAYRKRLVRLGALYTQVVGQTRVYDYRWKTEHRTERLAEHERAELECRAEQTE